MERNLVLGGEGGAGGGKRRERVEKTFLGSSSPLTEGHFKACERVCECVLS